ncbi:MAG: hypothetical protein KJP04_02270, partial [Arenicella sp.]|nr:hypothetical protein [Arenicella sp.]
DPFSNFVKISEALYRRISRTHKISLLRLYDHVFDIATEELQIDAGQMANAIRRDFDASGLKSVPGCLSSTAKTHLPEVSGRSRHKARQVRH